MTHCHREFFHAQWQEILDDEFMEAYEHGVVIKCCDGITRRFYLRIFAYSANYPEKWASKFCCLLFLTNRFSELFSLVFEAWEIVHVLNASFPKSA